MDVVRFGRRWKHVCALVALLAVVGSEALPAPALAAPPVDTAQSGPPVDHTGPGFQEHHEFRDGEEHIDVNACSTAIGPDQAHCDARVRIDNIAKSMRPAESGQPKPAGAIGDGGAYSPAYLESAYNVMSAAKAGAGSGQIVAIVDAFDSPSAASDLAKYRSTFQLPTLPACVTWPSQTACFRKVNQTGRTGPYPAPQPGWALEISLDVDMVSAMCPSCTILLVEANSASYTDLAAAVSEAVSLGANVVSNSYGGDEFFGEGTTMDSAFNHSGVAFTVSSGDSGYGVEYPAASPFVTAVGGTSLIQNSDTGTRDATETAWSGAGSGCSAYEPKPTSQTDTACPKNKTVADVSAVADTSTPVWVYDTQGYGGLVAVGGTSVAAPIVGSIYALAGNPRTSGQPMNALPYSHTTSLFDVTSGSNGTCGGTYLCTAVAGYDGPTGLGTPNGTTAFTTGASQPAADFALTASSTSLVVQRGLGSASDTLTLSAINGYDSSVQLSVSGLPAGVSATFSANPVVPSATSQLTLRATTRAQRGTRTLKITGTGADGKVHSQNIQLTVQ